jgi:hypothetical protein
MVHPPLILSALDPLRPLLTATEPLLPIPSALDQENPLLTATEPLQPTQSASEITLPLPLLTATELLRLTPSAVEPLPLLSAPLMIMEHPKEMLWIPL